MNERKEQVNPLPFTLHLNQKLGLYSTSRLRLVFASRRAQRVNLINEDDAWLVSSSQLKQIPDESENHNRTTKVRQVNEGEER